MTDLNIITKDLSEEDKMDLLSILRERQAGKKVLRLGWLDVYRNSMYPPGKRRHKPFILPGEDIAKHKQHSCV